MKSFISTYIDKKVQEDYNCIGTSFSETRQTAWPDWKILDKYFDDAQSVLDIGCGNGRLASYIQFKKYTGIDVAKTLLEIASMTYTSKKNIHFELGGFETLDVNGAYDRIISIASFHHLTTKSARVKALKNIHNALRKSGYFIVSVWNLKYIKKYEKQRRISKLISILTCGIFSKNDLWIPWTLGKQKRLRYYYAFNVKEITNLVIDAGFKIEHTYLVKNGAMTNLKDAHNIYLICKK